ncbi:flagellar motor switch protein FliN [Thermanaeromonas toyohensis ToBE]|uniref:Flagellar motor switch protein FliN n=1 Tax=Thermanaeromonas toyohensis ToBE TaxID=698762 RepID=A0A1W1VTA2_9FIRM|nr:FliM/FliN family flagellar motor switch protein [Thermanaeromonas toyohensis]SMB96597.1 flagellar motor switch protein FliN [Thermanaeromonas toyohensis ToBE]
MKQLLPLVREFGKKELPSWLAPRLARVLSSRLGFLLGRVVEAVPADGTVLGPGTFVAARGMADGFSAWIALTPLGFVHAVADTLLGGEPLVPDDSSPVTEGEATVLREFFQAAVEAAAEAVGVGNPAEVDVVEAVFRVPEGEYGTVDVALDVFGFPRGILRVVFLAPLREGGAQTRPVLDAVPLTVTVTVESVPVTAGEVASLAPVYLVLLDTADPLAVKISVEGTPVFAGRLGRRGYSFVVKIEGLLEGGLAVQEGNFVPLEVPEVLGDEAPTGEPLGMGRLHRVPLQLTVEVGRVVKTLAEVAELRPGDIIHLNKPSSAPVDLLVNGVVVARGVVVDAGGRYAVQVTEIFRGAQERTAQ